MSKKNAPLSRKEEEEKNASENTSPQLMPMKKGNMFAKFDDLAGLKRKAFANMYKKKSTVSQPGDPAEVQADAVAKAVTEGNASGAQVELQNDVSSGEITAKATDVSIETPEGFEEQIEKMKGGGLPLPDDKKTHFEEMLDTDLDHVRLHIGSDAKDRAEEINALAFASGDDIFYPGDINDEELLAHEVVHTVQGNSGFSAKINRHVDPETKTVFTHFETPKRAIVLKETITIHDDNSVESAVVAELRMGDSLLLFYDVESWYFVYDSTVKKRGYVKKEDVVAYEQETDTALKEADVTALQKLRAPEIAKARNIDWAVIKTLFRLDKDHTETKDGSYTFIRQKLLEGWRPEDGTPEIRTWYEDDMLVVDAWTPTLARIKVLEMGYTPDTGFVYRWNRSYYSHEKNKSSEVRKRSTFSLRDIKNQLELDFDKVSGGLTPFDGDIYAFSSKYGSFETFVKERESEKLATFVKFEKKGIAFDPPSTAEPQGGVKLRRTPFGEGETENTTDNLIGHLPFNTSFDILQYSSQHKWYYVQMENSGIKGYVASNLVRIPPEPTAKLHLITKNQSALEVVALYYSGKDARNYVLMLNDLNGAGIVHATTGRKEDWDETLLLKNYLIWIPGRLYASLYVLKQEDNFGSKWDQITDVVNEDKILKERQGLSNAETNDWTGIRDRVFRLDRSLIERFNNLTGISWTEFLFALGGISGLVFNLVKENYEAQVLDKDLKAKGSSLEELFRALTHFKKISLKKLFDLLDQSATVIQLEKQKYRSTETEGFKTLMKAIGTMQSGYDEADKLRATAIKRFFQTEDTSEEPTWRVYVDRSTMDDPDVGFFNHVKAISGNESELLKLLKAVSSEEVPVLLARYLRDYGSHSGSVVDHLKKNYPEFDQATAKETKVDEERVKAGQTDSPVLADNDPETDWREIARLDNREAIREQVIGILNRKAVNVKESRNRIAADTERIWELGPVLEMVLREQNIPDDSNIKLLVWDRVADHDRQNTMRSICLAALGIILGLLGFFTGGATWAVWASVAGSVIVSGVDLYFELKDYYFTKGASDTGIGSIIAVSDKHPSLIGVVFAILGLVIDAATLIKHGLKVAGIIGKFAAEGADTAKVADELYEELNNLKLLPPGLKKADFLKQMDELLKRDKELLEKHREAIEGLMKQLKITQKLDTVPSAVQYALARMYDINPGVTRAMIKAKNAHRIFLRLTLEITSNPNAADSYARLANLFMKGGEELSEEGITVMRYLTESLPGTLDECSAVVRVFESAGKTFDPKFMEEVLTDQRLRKMITDNPADLDSIAKSYDDWVKDGSKGSFADNVDLKKTNNTNTPNGTENTTQVSKRMSDTDIKQLGETIFQNEGVLRSRKRILKSDLLKKYPELTEEELVAVHHYTTGAYRELNTMIRTGTLDTFNTAFKKLVDSGLDKLKGRFGYEGPLFRGTSLPQSALDKIKNAFETKIPYSDSAFMSTTKDVGVTKRFQQLTKAPGDKNVIFYINSKTGVDIDAVSRYGPNFIQNKEVIQQEVLFSSGTPFNVLKYVEEIGEDGEPIVKIFLEEI